MALVKYALFIRYSLLIIIATVLWQCATITPPSGGDKDTTPPQIITNESSQNYQTNFTKQPIIITFDEWVELKDINKQVVISPPLEHPFELKIKKKSIVFKFDEEETLRDSTTYTINFGDAVKDITERNPAKDLRYVFSTGSFIDSLYVKGKLVDAITGEPQANALFMLYENKADSVVRTIKPFYFAKTDETGDFHIQNIKNSSFKGFALMDEDNNYKFSQPTEKIGFATNYITPSGQDTNAIDKAIIIEMFAEDLPLTITNVDTTSYGYIKCTFNQTPTAVDYQTKDLIDSPWVEWQADSLKMWYNQIDSSQWTLLIQRDSILNDTLTIHPQNKYRMIANHKLRAIEEPNKKALLTNKTIDYLFNYPIQSIDTSLLSLTEDTLTHIQPITTIDSLRPRQLHLQYPWKTAKKYALTLYPNAITNIYGISNQDTLQYNFIGDDAKLYGNISLQIDSLHQDHQYIFILKNKDEISRTIIKGEKQYKATFTGLSPGQYTVIIQTDLNENGYWNSGSYDHYRMPEPILTKELEKLRANWDVEATIIVEHDH